MMVRCSVVRTRADPSRGMQEQMRMLQEVVFCLTQLVKVVGFQGGSEGEAEQLTLSVGGVASKPLASNHGWQSARQSVVGIRAEVWTIPGPRAVVMEGEAVWFKTKYQKLCSAFSSPFCCKLQTW